MSDEVDIRKTGCHGFCESGPIVVMHPEEVCYLQIEPEDVPEIVSQTLQDKQVVERLLYVDPATGETDRAGGRDPVLQAPGAPRLRRQRKHRSKETSTTTWRSVATRALAKALSTMTAERRVGGSQEVRL